MLTKYEHFIFVTQIFNKIPQISENCLCIGAAGRIFAVYSRDGSSALIISVIAFALNAQSFSFASRSSSDR